MTFWWHWSVTTDNAQEAAVLDEVFHDLRSPARDGGRLAKLDQGRPDEERKLPEISPLWRNVSGVHCLPWSTAISLQTLKGSQGKWMLKEALKNSKLSAEYDSTYPNKNHLHSISKYSLVGSRAWNRLSKKTQNLSKYLVFSLFNVIICLLAPQVL